MQVIETLSEGLRRGLKIVVASDELDRRLNERLEEMRGTVQLKGFRRGKVPIAHLRRTFARRMMPELVENVVQESTREALDKRQERAVAQPKLGFGEGDDGLEKVMEGKADLAFTLEFEVMPEIEPVEFSKLRLKRPVAEVQQSDIDEALERVRRDQRRFEARPDGASAENGDRVTIDFVGRIDGEPFEGGSAEDAPLELGSGSFLPGFEEQLVGIASGEKRDVKLVFPDDYGAAHLAGKEAVFEVTAREVAAPAEATLDDAFAESLGFADLAALTDAIASRCKAEFAAASRARLKRTLLDELDGLYRFDLPPSLVESEFENIWRSVTGDLERAGRSFADEGTSEEKARAEYRTIAERRVRLGLVLATVSEKNGITVSQEEMNQALAERTRQFPGREAELLEFYRSNPQMLAELRSPLLEEKVVDFVLELAEVSDEPVSREALFAEPHDHDHDHGEDGHDHHHGHEHGGGEEPPPAAKPKRARRAKKAE
jgi:trigger factor